METTPEEIKEIEETAFELEMHALHLVSGPLTYETGCEEAANRIEKTIGTEYYGGQGDELLTQIVAFLRSLG